MILESSPLESSEWPRLAGVERRTFNEALRGLREQFLVTVLQRGRRLTVN